MAPIATNSDRIQLEESGARAGTVAPADAATNTPGMPARIPLFVAKDELFFWTAAWQAGEHDSAAARAAGETVEFDSATDLMKWLLSDDD